ncbi:MAG: Rieske (2Fe-2S) protein [Pseudomonadota bacterium]|nr:Rieske (2Fe-2S) protein [Pseudomonadota bacterium]
MNAPMAPRNIPLPAEGEGGVFSQSWFPVALSQEVTADAVFGTEFLDGRIVLFRAPDGTPRAMSAYCPHLGADLTLGKIVDGNVQCAFHHWEYDASGACVKTGIGDPAPKSACLFQFPVAERFGFVWVFNGEEALFDLPTLPFDDAELEFRAYRVPGELTCDPWVFASNTPDMQHLKVVHKIEFGVEDPHDLVDWHDYGMQFSYEGIHQGGVPLVSTAGIRGNSVFYRWGQYGDFWRGSIVGFGLPRPGHHVIYSCNAVMKGPAAQDQLDITQEVSLRTVNEDRELLNTAHYRQGTLTAGDKTLAKFFHYLRRYPRAHPSREFIN